MNTEKLIKMANQIGDFYEAYPDQSVVEQEIAGHLNKFWNSIMRKSIITYVNEHQGKGLHPRVIAAIQHHVHL